MQFGDVIAEKRNRMGLNQEKFAEQINSSRVSVSQWENNKCLPDITTLIKIAIFFNCTIDDLVNPTLAPAELQAEQGDKETA